MQAWSRISIGPAPEVVTLQWRHNERYGVSNHQPHDCLLTDYSGTDQRKHQSSASLAFVWGIHLWPLNSPHKGSVTRKMLTFDDVIMKYEFRFVLGLHLQQYNLSSTWPSTLRNEPGKTAPSASRQATHNQPAVFSCFWQKLPLLFKVFCVYLAR